MSIRVTIDIFSGRPNPQIVVSGRDESELLKALKPAAKLSVAESDSASRIGLGYRGVIVELLDVNSRHLPKNFHLNNGRLSGKGLMHRATEPAIEAFICESLLPRFASGDANLAALIRSKPNPNASSPQPKIKTAKARATGQPQPCKCAPVYEPAWWNDGGLRQSNNNCYNYSTDYRTDTFAQPGQAAGSMYSALNCPEVHDAALRDDLVDAKKQDGKCPESGHLVALVIAPEIDYHWYRLGADGYSGTAGASLFSGRPDPTWPASGELLKQVEALWELLPTTVEKSQAPPALGYRGCFVRGPRGEWRYFGHVVTKTTDDKQERRFDADGKFQEWILGSAPKDTIPASILRQLV